jgi:hypothetical protein
MFSNGSFHSKSNSRALLLFLFFLLFLLFDLCRLTVHQAIGRPMEYYSRKGQRKNTNEADDGAMPG